MREPDVADRRRRVRREPGRRRDSAPRTVRRSSCSVRRRCTDCRRCSMRARAEYHERAAGRGCQLSDDREVRRVAGAERRWPGGACVGDGRLQQILFVLRRAVYARPRSEPARGGRDARSGAAGAPGVREVTLLGQNVNAYRGDNDGDHRGPRRAACTTLPTFRASSGCATRRRIRWSSLTVSLRRMRRCRKLVSHLHLPVQSGSDRVLAMMKRGTTRFVEYKDKIRRAACGAARSYRSRPTSSSDSPAKRTTISKRRCGSSKNCASTCRSRSMYSARPGTPAAGLPDSTPPEVKRERLLDAAGAGA